MKFKILRAVFYLLVLVTIPLYENLRDYSLLPDEFWSPVGPFMMLRMSPLTFKQNTVLIILWCLSLLASSIGLGGRSSYFLAALLGTFAMSHAQSYGFVSHHLMPICIALWIWALFPKNPFRLTQLMFCLVFFSAGLSKITEGGIGWITGNTVKNLITRAYVLDSDIFDWFENLNINYYLLRLPDWFFNGLAAVFVFIELTLIVAWFSKTLSRFAIPLVLLFQIGIMFTMLLNFQSFLALYACWIPWIFDWEGIDEVSNRDQLSGIKPNLYLLPAFTKQLRGLISKNKK